MRVSIELHRGVTEDNTRSRFIHVSWLLDATTEPGQHDLADLGSHHEIQVTNDLQHPIFCTLSLRPLCLANRRLATLEGETLKAPWVWVSAKAV